MLLAHLSRKYGLHYTYIGTGYVFSYDKEHPVGSGKGFKEEGKHFGLFLIKPRKSLDTPTFFGSSYSVVKGFTDRQVKIEYISKISELEKFRCPISTRKDGSRLMHG